MAALKEMVWDMAIEQFITMHRGVCTLQKMICYFDNCMHLSPELQPHTHTSQVLIIDNGSSVGGSQENEIPAK